VIATAVFWIILFIIENSGWGGADGHRPAVGVFDPVLLRHAAGAATLMGAVCPS
jgi:hypothetical protein